MLARLATISHAEMQAWLQSCNYRVFTWSIYSFHFSTILLKDLIGIRGVQCGGLLARDGQVTSSTKHGLPCSCPSGDQGWVTCGVFPSHTHRGECGLLGKTKCIMERPHVSKCIDCSAEPICRTESEFGRLSISTQQGPSYLQQIISFHIPGIHKLQKSYSNYFSNRCKYSKSFLCLSDCIFILLHFHI